MNVPYFHESLAYTQVYAFVKINKCMLKIVHFITLNFYFTRTTLYINIENYSPSCPLAY